MGLNPVRVERPPRLLGRSVQEGAAQLQQRVSRRFQGRHASKSNRRRSPSRCEATSTSANRRARTRAREKSSGSWSKRRKKTRASTCAWSATSAPIRPRVNSPPRSTNRRSVRWPAHCREVCHRCRSSRCGSASTARGRCSPARRPAPPPRPRVRWNRGRGPANRWRSAANSRCRACPGGGTCPTTLAERKFAPGYTAKSDSTKAGAYSPFRVHIGRPDGQQELKVVNVTLPKGLTGKLAGVPYCSEAALVGRGGQHGQGRAGQSELLVAIARSGPSRPSPVPAPAR